MGVTGILVGNGVNLGALRQGLTKFSQNWNTSQKNKQKWISKFSQKPDSSEKIDQKWRALYKGICSFLHQFNTLKIVSMAVVDYFENPDLFINWYILFLNGQKEYVLDCYLTICTFYTDFLNYFILIKIWEWLVCILLFGEMLWILLTLCLIMETSLFKWLKWLLRRWAFAFNSLQ